MYEFLDRRYALALYNTCLEKGNLDVVLEQFSEIVEQFQTNEGIRKILKNPQITKFNKKRIFKELFEGQIEDQLMKFLLILIDRGRILFLKEKYEQFRSIYLFNQNTMVAKVISTVPLSQQETERLHKELEERYGKKIIIENEIDKSILGGLVVNIGNESMDGSVKSKLDEIKDLTHNVGSDGYEKIRKIHRGNDVSGNGVQNAPLQVEVITAVALSDEEKDKLKNSIKSFYDRDVVINERIDEDVLGGIKVKIGNDIIDGTVKDRLKYIKRDMFVN